MDHPCCYIVYYFLTLFNLCAAWANISADFRSCPLLPTEKIPYSLIEISDRGIWIDSLFVIFIMQAQPKSLDFKTVLLTNEHGTSEVPWLRKRLTHPLGWMCMMMGGSTYRITYENGGHFTNTSYSGTYYNFNTTDYIIFEQQLFQKPDKFQTVGGPESNGSQSELTYADNVHGDWHLGDNLTFSYIGEYI